MATWIRHSGETWPYPDDHVKGACLAMSRFLTFVWMEAFAQKWIKKTERNVQHKLEDTEWRDHAFWHAWNKGLIKVTWP